MSQHISSLLFSSYIALEATEVEQDSGGKLTDKIFGDEEEFDGGLIDLDDLAMGLKDGGDFGGGQDDDENGDAIKDLSALSGDIKIVEFVKTALNDFYKNEMYESTFIEKIAIADPYFESPELKNMLEKKLMMNVTHKKIELSKITATLAMEEVVS